MSCDDELILGREKVFEFEFKTLGVLADPSALRFQVQSPDALVPTEWVYLVDPEITKVSLGRFRVRWLPDIAGWWQWRMESDGVVWADQGKFRVVAALL